MPSQIGEFISQRVYEGQLQSYSGHVVPSSAIACRFVDVNGSEKLDKDGKSLLVSIVLALYFLMRAMANCVLTRDLQNLEEVDAIMLLAQHFQDENISYRIITPYDAQRSALEQALKEEDLNWEDKCFNVDSFQGLY